MSTTISSFLPRAPYNFTSDQIGLMALPRMIGVSIGALISGPLSDWWIVYISRKKNGGVYDPESRLWCIIPFLPFVPAGALLFGIGLNNGLAWPIIAVGLALYCIGTSAINSLVITYLTDSYREVSLSVSSVLIRKNAYNEAGYWRRIGWRYSHTKCFQHCVYLRPFSMGCGNRSQVCFGDYSVDCLRYSIRIWCIHQIWKDFQTTQRFKVSILCSPPV